jgi:hypothetical protein
MDVYRHDARPDHRNQSGELKKKTRRENGGLKGTVQGDLLGRRLLLPRALFMAISFQALSALVLVHLQAAFLFQVAHVTWKYVSQTVRFAD